ncbi:MULTISPECIES: hypothetical protein [Paraburkholderia]|uniref:Secreted protein n=1 Tax=Paraburkholderia madseniana TaxID=2599607 RepID=A0AAP5ES46_9BURK|nr:MULTISPECIES: hypothetical protein [Paraburkholderia]MCX4151039.1 hypothetical protein [Paraburkholderia madseniana]MCX4176679.1 hypothetical protein [Paraburkholderia madseniana]MDN7153971.1 hypothetical protein [Paraburkholderia sp. WS6]MDQ6412853.1 hypothetical protein [Paraburkholderia madseniana]MDQ6464670.1 hypothetical protein [Paraburkholderia madseniana]
MKFKSLMLICVFSVSATSSAAATDDGVTFARRGPHMLGAVELAPQNGGEYVFSSKPESDRRVHMRFLLGKPQRQDVEMFSGEEEAALAKLRAEQLGEIQATYDRLHQRHVKHRVKPKLNWPQVIVEGDRTCVPSSGHASDVDWKSHLVCWNVGTQRVE